MARRPPGILSLFQRPEGIREVFPNLVALGILALVAGTWGTLLLMLGVSAVSAWVLYRGTQHPSASRRLHIADALRLWFILMGLLVAQSVLTGNARLTFTWS